MRAVDAALTQAWADGLVPGEYHSGIGEEGIIAGLLLHLTADDAIALDHRSTGVLVGRGTDPESLMLECLGSERGMCGGMAGHMHLIDPDVRSSADGIVGASAPIAVGEALAAQRLRPGSVAVSIHGEGAMNQGLLLEAYNLAVVWQLPVVFVCKDNKWSITTRTAEVTAGGPVRRAKAFGLAVESVDGRDVADVYAAAGRLVARARSGRGPGFLHATCHRPSGHFEGDPLVRVLRDPVGQARTLAPGLSSAVRSGGAGRVRERLDGVSVLGGRLGRVAVDWTRGRRGDPLVRARRRLADDVAGRIEEEVVGEIGPALERARAAVAGRPVYGVAGTEGGAP